MSAPVKPIAVRPESITTLVYEAVRDAVVSHRFGPGDRVTEAALAEWLQVSKTPVREALNRLTYIGLIEPDGRRGGRVVRASKERIRSAYELRTALEVEAARLSAARSTEVARAELRAFAEASRVAAAAGDRHAFGTEDRHFHFALAASGRNSILEHSVRDAYDLTWTLRSRDVPVADASIECADQHIRVSEAIDKGDVATAGEALRTHLKKVSALVLESFQGAAES